MPAGYRLLAADYVRRQARRLALQLEGVRAAEEVEHVHRARVATRRLRAALRVFDECFTPKQVRRWRKAIRRTTAALGKARDRDVQIEFLCDALAALGAKDCTAGVAHVLVRLERSRQRLQPRAVKAIDRLERKGTLREMRRAAKRIIAASDASPQDVRTPEVVALIGRHVDRRIDKLLQHQDGLANPDDHKRHHAMRIAAKRLRYTLEIARAACPGRLEGAVEAMKKVQTLLGEVHDCDVWLDQLEASARDERRRMVACLGHAGRFTRLAVGIEYLRQDRLGRREKTFAELVEYWAELGRQGFWDELKRSVQCVERSAEQGGPGE
jgi:CHAD domain-containing protein